ncbi:MAG TPA: hypothetical protein VHX65_14970 [Pirellulales bacterium]|jgi:hypothetical protein|nr:hypothetical protein [Pirellulales bacterium]
MMVQHPTPRLWIFLAATAMLLPAARLLADDSASSGSNATNGSGTDFFAAIQSGDLTATIIPHDSRRAQVILKNNTDQPLTVKLPDAFVAMPVVAQAAGLGGNNAGGNNRNTTTNNNNKNQTVGGGMGGMGGGAGGGMFSIPPERVVKLQLPVVCLEYGKAEPSAHVPYTIVPAEKYTSDPELQEVCRQLGDSRLDQRAAQAAAWHVANHMSWDDLASLKTFPHFPQYSRPYFSGDEIHQAMAIVDQAIKAADARKTSGSAASAATPSANTNP